MASEKVLNNYYNIGGFNKPERIGYMMSMIRELRPFTVEEWQIWYTNNVHDYVYIDNIAIEMHRTIPPKYNISSSDCRAYVYDVMFRRTFQGYNKENLALKYLQSNVSGKVQEAPKEWDTQYFIDFFIPEESTHPLIGIQLKPDTFYRGNYQIVVDIEGKMNEFRSTYRALAYVLKYRQLEHKKDTIEFTNQEVIEEIQNIL